MFYIIITIRSHLTSSTCLRHVLFKCILPMTLTPISPSDSQAATSIVSFLAERGFLCQAGERIRYHDVAALVVLINKQRGTARGRDGSVPQTRFLLRSWILEHVGDGDAITCPMGCLRPAVNEFCELSLTNAHMADIAQTLEQDPSLVKKRRTVKCLLPLRPAPLKSSVKAFQQRFPRQQLNMEERFKIYDGWSQAETRSEMLRLEDDADCIKQRVHELQMELAATKAKLNTALLRVEALEEENADLLSQVQYRKGFNSHVSIRGGYMLAKKSRDSCLTSDDGHHGRWR